MQCACSIAWVTKINTTYARVNLTKTRSNVHSQIFWITFWVCVFLCATGMGPESVIHFPALPLYSGRTAKRVGMIFNHDPWRKITWSTKFIIIIIIFICLILTIKKNLFTALTARRRGDPGRHRAYGRATSLIIIYQVKEKCCECRDYLSKNSCIFFLKLRRFDKRVTGTGRELQI